MEFTTGKGKVRGRREADCIRISRLRYAKAPIGPRRFALPEPVAPWEGVLDCTEPPVAAPQLASRLAGVMGDYPMPQSEDCLHLDIWIPRDAKGPLPVVVFIHGGAFMTGAGGMACYDGGSLAASRKVVVVNITYRLGVLGFLPIEAVAPANLGLHDQVLALGFIRDEIAAFGGDAANITAIGQSAGAYSLAVLATSDEGPRLFDKAVLMSAPLGIEPSAAGARADLARDFGAAFGIASSDGDGLRNAPVADVLRAQLAVLKAHVGRGAPDNVDPPFMPVMDGLVIAASPMARLAEGKASWCPMMLGWTREEYAAFWFDRTDMEPFATEVLPGRFEEAFPGEGAARLDAFRARRPGASALAILSDLHTDKTFAAPTVAAAAAHAGAGGHNYVYRFDWQSPDPRIGACHCIELPFLFGNLDTWRDAAMVAGAPADELSRLSDDFQSAIATFARSGRPTRPGASWSDYGASADIAHFGATAAK